jgi:hypothetical protein
MRKILVSWIALYRESTVILLTPTIRFIAVFSIDNKVIIKSLSTLLPDNCISISRSWLCFPKSFGPFCVINFYLKLLSCLHFYDLKPFIWLVRSLYSKRKTTHHSNAYHQTEQHSIKGRLSTCSAHFKVCFHFWYRIRAPYALLSDNFQLLLVPLFCSDN